jgi:hypothetical protein
LLDEVRGQKEGRRVIHDHVQVETTTAEISPVPTALPSKDSETILPKFERITEKKILPAALKYSEETFLPRKYLCSSWEMKVTIPGN